jgi:hypothetical protein
VIESYNETSLKEKAVIREGTGSGAINRKYQWVQIRRITESQIKREFMDIIYSTSKFKNFSIDGTEQEFSGKVSIHLWIELPSSLSRQTSSCTANFYFSLQGLVEIIKINAKRCLHRMLPNDIIL